MKTLLPTASRKRLEELLTYLGDRAKDFKKCFDINSPDCWRYADLMLRGMKKRKMKYAEGHHVVPASFYGKRNKTVDEHNLTSLSYGEHVLAHKYAALSCIGKLQGKMAFAFYSMYNMGKQSAKPVYPTDEEILSTIPKLEVIRIRSMIPRVAKLDAEGRTHKWEDPVKAAKEYRDMHSEERKANAIALYYKNREAILEQKKVYHIANKEARNAYNREYQKKNAEKRKAYRKQFAEENPERVKEYNKRKYQKHRTKILEQKKLYHAEHKDVDNARCRKYHAEHKEAANAKCREYRAANREKLNAKCREWHAEHREYANAKRKALYYEKVAAGFRDRRDPVTGKRGWVFVGLPSTPETPKSSTTAA